MNKKREMRTKKLTRDYILLAILTLMIVLLIILFNIITYTKSERGPFGLPSIGLWKPFENAAKITNLSENESLIEKNKQSENPSDTETIKEIIKQQWASYLILLSITVLIILWIMIVFRIYNG